MEESKESIGILKKKAAISAKLKEIESVVGGLQREMDKLLYSDEYKKAEIELKPKPTYKTEINKIGVVTGKETFEPSLPIGTQFIQFQRTLLNKNSFDEYLIKFGSICNMPEEHTSSVTYYIFNNVLMHEGGGYIFFKTPQLLTQEQQQQLFNGDIRNIE